MLLVKTKIGPSQVNGIGLFAAQFIPKGTPVWRFQSGFDLKIDKSGLAKLSAPAKEQFLKYAYLDPETRKYFLCFDDTRFSNHSDNPNCVDGSPGDAEGVDIAARDIRVGEELTFNYKEFDAGFADDLTIQ